MKSTLDRQARIGFNAELAQALDTWIRDSSLLYAMILEQFGCQINNIIIIYNLLE